MPTGPGWVIGRIGRVPGGPLHFWAGRELNVLTFVTLVLFLKVGYTRSPIDIVCYSMPSVLCLCVRHSDTAASAWVVPCEEVLPSQIELVGSIARLFQKVFSDALAWPALPQRYASGRMDGRQRPVGAEKPRLKKRKALEEDAAKCAKLTDLFFKRTNTSGNW